MGGEKKKKTRGRTGQEHCFEDVETRYHYARKLLEDYLGPKWAKEKESAAMSRYRPIRRNFPRR